ncbi:MAG: NADH-quinone oxidoreductase subunit N [Phycisphaerales bacterium JB043]
MAEKLTQLHPEIALFITTCVVMVLGLMQRALFRTSCALISGVGLAIAAWLSLESPRVEGAIFPGILPYTKTLIALVALLLLPVFAGLMDRDLDASAQKTGRFDALRAVRGEFYAFFLFSVTGVMLCASADDMIWLFLALELTSLPTYVMVAASSKRMRAQEAGVKYFFLGAFGAAMFLYGFALLYGATGTTELAGITSSIRANGGDLGAIGNAGMLLAIVGISFKIAAVPMHAYAADVYQGAASPVSAYLAFAPKAAGFISLMTLIGAVGWDTGTTSETIRLALWVMAVLTMVVGNVLALLQTSVKRILAYSSIAHSGYMLVGLIVGPGILGQTATNGLAAMLFYLAVYGVSSVGTFAVIACLQKDAGSGEVVEAESIDDLKGLCATHPVLGWSFVVCVLSLLGFPPLLGFFGKLALFGAAIHAGEIMLVVILGLNSAVAAWYYLRMAAAALIDTRPSTMYAPSYNRIGWRAGAAFVSALCAIVLVFFITPLQSGSDEATRENVTLASDEPANAPLSMRD